MKIQKTYNINFGWQSDTHKKVVEIALKDYPGLQPYESLLEDAVQKPDVNEKGFQYNKHFYFMSKNKSFMDFNGKNNAYNSYMSHVTSMQDCIEKGDKDKAIEHAGRAIHFLQDVSQPQHTQWKNIFKKASERSVHEEFETFALDNQEKFIDSLSLSPEEKSPDNFSDLFTKTANCSANGESASRENKNNWNNIAQDGINNAFSVTKEFINKFNSLLVAKN